MSQHEVIRRRDIRLAAAVRVLFTVTLLRCRRSRPTRWTNLTAGQLCPTGWNPKWGADM